jgi:hypothetical protein
VFSAKAIQRKNFQKALVKRPAVELAPDWFPPTRSRQIYKQLHPEDEQGLLKFAGGRGLEG